jgi:phosphatidate cytidylyltransferase
MLFSLLSILLVSGMLWEWGSLLKLRTRALVLYVVVVWMTTMPWVIMWRGAILSVGFLWLLTPVLFFIPLKKTELLRNTYVHLILGPVLMMPFWLALNMMQQFDRNFLAFIILLVIVFDTSCYGIGNLMGERKLLPSISPNKTVEGLVGGVIAGLLMAIIIPFLVPSMSHLQTAHGFLTALVTVSFAAIGDLFESLVKRQFDVKDTGVILPGHGGLLDRLDSLLAALPAVFCLLIFWGQYYRG